MIYDPQWVRDYYNADGIGEWERFDLHPVLRLAFGVHCHYLRQYISPSDRVLEIGAGYGRFTQVLAGIVSHITVADISPGQLAGNRLQAERLGFAHAVEEWVECDICDLREYFAHESFDTVVCYGGALSYVFNNAEQALCELQRVVKPGGVLFIEVMSLWGTIHHALAKVLAISSDKNRDIIATGNLDGSVSTHRLHMYRAQEFRALLERSGLTIDVMTAGTVLSENWIDALRQVPEDSATWRHLLEMELEACREPGCLDMGEHLIAVCRKVEEIGENS